MNKSIRIHGAVVLALFAIGTATLVKADHRNDDKARLRTRLAGAAIAGKTPAGNADFRMESAKGRTQLTVEVENVNLPENGKLTVSVQGTVVGQITLAAGLGELELVSQDGDAVPAVSKGMVVTVANAGTTILAGSF